MKFKLAQPKYKVQDLYATPKPLKDYEGKTYHRYDFEFHDFDDLEQAREYAKREGGVITRKLPILWESVVYSPSIEVHDREVTKLYFGYKTDDVWTEIYAEPE